MEKNRSEWVMHVWGKKRDSMELNNVEKFHIHMLQKFQEQYKKFDKILVNIAMDDINDTKLFDFLKENIGGVLTNGNVEFKMCQNDSMLGEYVTFKPYVFDRIGEDVNVFYSHFKGYATFVKVLKESFPTRVINFNELFWAELMYQYSLNVDDVNDKLNDKCTYSWFVVNDSEKDYFTEYYTIYHDRLKEGNKQFEESKKDDLHKYSPGSFSWYNLKRIGEKLKDEPWITSINTEYLLANNVGDDINLCSHFCEAYLMNFLDADECYSVNDFNKEIHDMYNPFYVSLYTSKIIGKEYLKDFEKYLIDNQLI